MSRKQTFQFFDGIQKDVLANAQDEIQICLKSLCDPKSGQLVKVTKQCHNGDSTWKVDGAPQVGDALKEITEGG